jgi:putative drug exporter of the RND superfamily
VVYERRSGLTPADLRKAAADAHTFARLPGSGQVIGPVPSKDRQAMETVIEAHLGYDSAISTYVTTVRRIAGTGDPGLSAHVAGPAASARPTSPGSAPWPRSASRSGCWPW